MKLLIVDDEQGWREVMQDLLEEAGHEVESAAHGGEAKDLLVEGRKYDVLLSDVRMPVMDGMELLRYLVRAKITIPTILITGHSNVQIAVEALKLGAIDILLKPLPFHVLQNALERVQARQAESHRQTELITQSRLELQLQVPSRAELVGTTVQMLRPFYQPHCEAAGVPYPSIDLCIQEALTNAIVHGNLELPSKLKDISWADFEELVEQRSKESPYQERRVCVQVHSTKELFRLSLEDEGAGFDPNRRSAEEGTDPLQLHGRGLLLIQGIMDKVAWNEKGNRIEMTKSWERSDANSAN